MSRLLLVFYIPYLYIPYGFDPPRNGSNLLLDPEHILNIFNKY